MPKVLIVGAGTFGKAAAAEFRDKGYTVDILDKSTPNQLRLPDYGGQMFCTNAFNIGVVSGLVPREYDCCVVAIRAEGWMLCHVTETLHQAGAPNIQVRVRHLTRVEEQKLLAAGATRLVRVEKLAAEQLTETFMESVSQQN